MANSTSTGDEKESSSDVAKVEEVCEDKGNEKQDSPEADSASKSDASPGTTKADGDTGEKVDFKVIFNKKKHDVTFPLDSDVGALKSHLQPLIGIQPDMMKVMIKGLARDEMTLRKLGVVKGSKIMVVGSSINDVLQMSSTPKDLGSKGASGSSSKEESSVTKVKQHKKILDRGKPDDVMPGKKSGQDPLPPHPLTGMLNTQGGKVRLTFKMDVGQVWIGTKERTQKVPFNNVKNVVSEPIPEHDGYHILALQLGPTEASRYYIYWLPAQYIDAIKDAIMGKFQYF